MTHTFLELASHSCGLVIVVKERDIYFSLSITSGCCGEEWRMLPVEQSYPSSTSTSPSPSTSSKPSTPPSLAPAPTSQPCPVLGRSLPAQMALSSGPQKDNYCTCSVLAQPSYEFILKNNRNLEAGGGGWSNCF